MAEPHGSKLIDLMSRVEPTLGSLEEEYRLTFLKDDMRLSSIGIVLWILFNISFAYNDYLFLGNTGQFWLLFFCRVALVSYGIVLLFVFTVLERVAIYELVLLTFLIVAALFIFYVNTTRPSSYQMNLTLDVLTVFALYLLFPINIMFRIIVGFLFSLCVIVTVTIYRDFSTSPATITMFLSLMLANAAGLIVGARWGYIRRQSFKALVQSQSAAEEFLQAKNEWQLTFDSVPDLIMIIDEKHSIIRANKATTDKLGVTPQELIGKKCFEHIHGEESAPSFCPHSKLLADSKPHQAELAERRLGGVFDVSVSPLLDATGRLLGSVHVARDITARKKAEEALRESEERYRLLVDLSPDGICMYTKGSYVFANKSMARILGLQTPEEVIGKEHLDLIHPTCRELVKERMTAVLANDKPVPMVEEKIVRYDGTVVDVEVAAAPVSYRGRPSGLAVIRDITARKKDEEKREQLVEELQSALAEVKKLSGFLPICASCKKIRDDKGYWQQIEEYISDHSEALFSHSICPECARKLYPEMFSD